MLSYTYQQLYLNAISNRIYEFVSEPRPLPPYGPAWDWLNAAQTSPITLQPEAVNTFIAGEMPKRTVVDPKSFPSNSNCVAWLVRLNTVFTDCNDKSVSDWLKKEYAFHSPGDPPSVPDFVIEWTKPKLPPPQAPSKHR